MSGGAVTLGIRTFANVSTASHDGNVIVGNRTKDVAQHIGDGHTSSVISGNSMQNTSVVAASVGINTVSDDMNAVAAGNSFVNIGHPIHQNSGAIGGSVLLAGPGAPTSDPGRGSIYMQKDGVQGATVWFTDLFAGTPAWYRRNQMPLCTVAQLPTAAQGLVFYATDGTPGSDPITGTGVGALAIYTSAGGGRWRGV